MDNEKVSDLLNVEPDTTDETPQEIVKVDRVELDLSSDDCKQQLKEMHKQQDFDLVRCTMINLLEQGQEVIGNAINVAQASESPRAFEVVSGLMKNLSEISNSLLDAHEKAEKIMKKEATNNQHQQTNIQNAVFVGSMKELTKQIREENGRE